MVSLIGTQQYQETSLDGENFGIKTEKIFHCYKHIQGATVVSCGFSHYDEFLFGKHRQWFCRFRNEKCLNKCQDCADMIAKCLETIDCTPRDDVKDKKEKKSFFSRFSSKKTEHKEDKSEIDDTESLDDNITNQEEKVNNEEDDEQKLHKKTFFSIFGHDVQEIEQPKEEVEENVNQNNIEDDDLNSTVDAKETSQESKPKKKSFFSKFSKKEQTVNDNDEKTETKWHDDSTDEDIQEEKPKKKSSFFSRFSKKDLTKISDSEDEEKSEQVSLDNVNLHNEEEEKEKKKSFFSKFSKSNHTKDKKVENYDTVSHDPSEHSEEESEIVKSKDKKKKKFFSRSSNKKEHDSDDESDNESETQSKEEPETSKEKTKKSFFSRFSKKSHTEEDSKTEENSLAGDLEDNEAGKNNIENKEEKPKKKSFFSKSPKKEKEVKQDSHEVVDNPESTVENQEIIENQEENGTPTIKRERRKSFLAIFSKKDEDSDSENEIETEVTNEGKDGGDTDKKKSSKKDKKKEEKDKSKDEETTTGTKLTRKKSFLSKSLQDLTKSHKHAAALEKKSFEDCKICFTKFKNCINNCYNCYTRIEEYNWFDHCILKHSIMMESKQYSNETIAFYLNTKFNKKMQFCFTAFNYTFFFDFIFSSGSIIINMVSNIEEDYACNYFTCHYTLSWLDTNFTDELIFTGQEFWDWNVHTILSDKDTNVDETFFDKCKLLIKVIKL